MKILFVGSNPSQSAGIHTPFWANTASAKVLSKWIDQLSDVESLAFINVYHLPTENNRPLKMSEIRDNLSVLKFKVEYNKDHMVVALGKTAEKALTLLGVKFFSMPHPSGKNRKLNDKAYLEEKIKGLKLFLKPSKD